MSFLGFDPPSMEEEKFRESKMWQDLILQAVLILFSVVMFLAIYGIPQRFLSRLRLRRRSDIRAKRHFVNGAQLLSQASVMDSARSAPSRSASASLARDAAAEADLAISIDPRDAAAHILKALALDLQGFRTSALDALDAALSPLAIKSLGDTEVGDALYKRAEIKVALGNRGTVDSAVDDLTRALKLRPSPKGYSLLGQCYEKKKMKAEAEEAYKEAVKLEPTAADAREALARFGLQLD